MVFSNTLNLGPAAFELGRSLSAFRPEMALLAAAIIVLLADLGVRKKEARSLYLVPIVGVVVACSLMINEGMTKIFGEEGTILSGYTIFRGQLVFDPPAFFFRFLILVGTAFTVLMSRLSTDLKGRRTGEFYALVLFAAFGMFLMSSAVNLLTLYISIEIASLSCYCLAGYFREKKISAEASLKYMVFGAVASAVMLYGISLIYGLAGSLDLNTIQLKLNEELVEQVRNGGFGRDQLILWVSLIFILAGFAYKISAVPFHFWAPDTYQGAPTPITAFISTVSKIAGFVVLMRFTWIVFYGVIGLRYGTASSLTWSIVLQVMAVLSMTVGTLAAVVQKDIKRLLAYSAIGHAGYILLGICAMNADGEGMVAAMFYLFVYLFMNIGAFVVVQIVENRTGSTELEAYNGLAWRSPWLAVAMGVVLFSLAGIPPTAGFPAKFFVFKAVITEANTNPNLYFVLLIAAFNIVVGLFVYMRPLYHMAFKEPSKGDFKAGAPGMILSYFCAVPLMLFGVFSFPPLFYWVYDIAQRLFEQVYAPGGAFILPFY